VKLNQQGVSTHSHGVQRELYTQFFSYQVKNTFKKKKDLGSRLNFQQQALA
jgi:hypothetical protein